MARFAVILPAAGKSERFSENEKKKPFVDLKGRAVWVRTAELFVNRDDVVQTLVVIAPDDLEWFKDRYRPNLAFMDIEIIAGGARRIDSVANAVAEVRGDVDFVAVHDAARPLLVKSWISTVFSAAEQHGAVIPAVRVTSTLKRIGEAGTIAETVSRDGVWEAQTPQVFRRDLLVKAVEQRGESEATDEAQLVEQAGHAVHVIDGWPMNLKITTRADFDMARALVNALPDDKPLTRLHPFSDEDPRDL